MFGSNEDGYLLKNDTGELFKAALLNIRGERGQVSRLKVEESKESVKFIPVA